MKHHDFKYEADAKRLNNGKKKGKNKTCGLLKKYCVTNSKLKMLT